MLARMVRMSNEYVHGFWSHKTFELLARLQRNGDNNKINDGQINIEAISTDILRYSAALARIGAGMGRPRQMQFIVFTLYGRRVPTTWGLLESANIIAIQIIWEMPFIKPYYSDSTTYLSAIQLSYGPVHPVDGSRGHYACTLAHRNSRPQAAIIHQHFYHLVAS